MRWNAISAFPTGHGLFALKAGAINALPILGTRAAFER
jgi:hypothetical protein